MVFRGHVGFEQARILLDLGAADAYVSKCLAKKLSIACPGAHENVTMADGEI